MVKGDHANMQLPKSWGTIVWVIIAIIVLVTFCQGLHNCSYIPVG
jgi:hypothetical protein